MNKEIEKIYSRLDRLTDMVSSLYVDIDKKEEKFKEQVQKVSQKLEGLRIENELQNTQIDNNKKAIKDELERNKS